MPNKPDLIIIGAGLTGLYAATLLQNSYNVIILEARERIGGRIYTKEGHDLGPSWIWPHQKNILALVNELNLELFSQFTKGDALYDAPKGVERFTPPPSASSQRIQGGLEKLINALASKLPSDTIHTNEEVHSVIETDDKLIINTNTKQYQAFYVLNTLAPRLACENITYTPSLNDNTIKQMLQTPTWMGHTAKCVIEFKDNFWKGQGLSGFVYSPLGPLGEIHDASTKTQAALFGFLHAHASTKNIKEDVKEQMKRLFPQKVELISNIFFMDWRDEKFTSSKHDRRGLTAHPQYGLSLSHFHNRMFFMGTESAYDNGGYLEGAIVSAKNIASILTYK